MCSKPPQGRSSSSTSGPRDLGDSGSLSCITPPAPCSPSRCRALHSLDGDALHILGTPGIDVALRVFNCLKGWVGPVLLQGRASTMAEWHRGLLLPSTPSSSPCLSHPSPCPSTSKTGTTSVWELRRMERRRGFVPCQVRTSTTRPWHTCGRKGGCHQGPGWGQKDLDQHVGAKKHQLGKSFLMPAATPFSSRPA